MMSSWITSIVIVQLLCTSLTKQLGISDLDAESNWPNCSPPYDHFQDESSLLAPAQITVENLIEKSTRFPIKFPIETVRCAKLKEKVSKSLLKKYINSVYPVVHEKALQLFSGFLSHKKTEGSVVEKKLYRQMTLLQLVNRLLTKRAVVFFATYDQYMFLDGFTDVAFSDWKDVGTFNEAAPLILKNCLSYDEIRLSALLSVSSLTHFINDGTRNNVGNYNEDRRQIEDEGVIIGLTGPRLERERVMEYREVVKSSYQNTHRNGYGKSFEPTTQAYFSEFYGDAALTYEELQLRNAFSNTNRYFDLGNGTYFDRKTYTRRIALSIDTLMIEANARAKESNKTAFVHVVGIGLGAWKIASIQDQLFVDTFARRLEFLGKTLTHISDVCFAHIQVESAGKYKNGDKVPIPDHQGITIVFRNRKPHERLSGNDTGKLLVVSYAGNGNALPGNMFWFGFEKLFANDEAAVASSTQVAELHNAHINSKVSAANLRVATLKGLLTFKEYVEEQETRSREISRQ